MIFFHVEKLMLQATFSSHVDGCVLFVPIGSVIFGKKKENTNRRVFLVDVCLCFFFFHFCYVAVFLCTNFPFAAIERDNTAEARILCAYTRLSIHSVNVCMAHCFHSSPSRTNGREFAHTQ